MKAMRYYLSWGLGILFLLTLIISCAVGPPVGSPQSGYSIHGFVGKTANMPAMQENVLLINANTKQPVDTEKTNFLGKYTFAGLPPGFYIVQVADKQLPVFLKNKNVRQDINLSAADGKMDYLSHNLKKAEKRPHQAQQLARPQSTAQGWPKYERPKRSMTGDESDLQSLLYKFAGRWDHVTSNTLTNLYLKPDGTYEESYEAGYAGQFQDQGGYQTGHWGATGTDQGQGRWTIQGTLKRGTLTLITSNGNRTVYQYRVHYKNGEYYWGEYFFNGKLYSVKYIYR